LTRESSIALTPLALIAFASNSVLTRLALGAHQIDAASFTAVRLLSGALVLALVVRAKEGGWAALVPRDLAGPGTLIVYAVPFSLGYVRIGAAIGALVLFSAVQFTMVAYGIAKGERPRPLAWLGLATAVAGLALLTAPSAQRPDTVGVLLMAAAGAAWGAYSIAGRSEPDPIVSNARNFLWSAPLALLLSATVPGPHAIGARGVLLAVVSGAVTSAGGYIVWYRALRELTVTAAAVAQLAVPVLAAFGAVLFLGEPANARMVLSGAIVVVGIALVVASRGLSSQAAKVRRRQLHTRR